MVYILAHQNEILFRKAMKGKPEKFKSRLWSSLSRVTSSSNDGLLANLNEYIIRKRQRMTI